MRGVTLTYETVREWCLKFGQTYANGLRRKSPRPGDRWHLDEVFLKINGRPHYLWRAVDPDGEVLDILVQNRRDKKAAKKFFRKLLKGLRYVPSVIITDKLKSYSAAKAEVMPSVEHLQQKYQNNRAENSHQPTRLREKVMRRFKSAGHAGAIPLGLRTDLVTFSSWPTSLFGERLSRSNEGQICGLERCHRGPVGILKSAIIDRQVVTVKFDFSDRCVFPFVGLS